MLFEIALSIYRWELISITLNTSFAFKFDFAFGKLMWRNSSKPLVRHLGCLHSLSISPSSLLSLSDWKMPMHQRQRCISRWLHY